MQGGLVTCGNDLLHCSPVIVRIYNEKFLFSVCKENGDSSLKLTGNCSVGLLIYSFMYVVTSVKNLVYTERCNCCRNYVPSSLTEFNEYGNQFPMLKS